MISLLVHIFAWPIIMIVPGGLLLVISGWSELVATNAPVEDEPVQPVLRMNILLARRDFFFHLLSAPKFSTSPPPTYHLPSPSPPPLTPSPELQRPRAAMEWELERLELERDPRAHEKVRCLLFLFLFCLFCLKKA